MKLHDLTTQIGDDHYFWGRLKSQQLFHYWKLTPDGARAYCGDTLVAHEVGECFDSIHPKITYRDGALMVDTNRICEKCRLKFLQKNLDKQD